MSASVISSWLPALFTKPNPGVIPVTVPVPAVNVSQAKLPLELILKNCPLEPLLRTVGAPDAPKTNMSSCVLCSNLASVTLSSEIKAVVIALSAIFALVIASSVILAVPMPASFANFAVPISKSFIVILLKAMLQRALHCQQHQY